MTGGNEIRSTFVDYFARNGHTHVPSSPLVPHNDPTLMFTNAGMVQFKNVFTGQEKRDYSRAVTSQKCVRAGGKHNDLDNVGYTARHHTFFEMLGNFSFGDYFKDQAIELAWNLVTREYGLARDRLLVTVYSEDEEAATLWKQIAGLSDDRIIRIPTSDNFWSMGDTGPCGPCSEIFFDHGDHIPGGPPGSPDEDGDRFIEIWNLVFMQYEQVDAATRNNLPRPSIDTGMGLERITATLNGTHDNYATDLLRNLIEQSAHLSDSDPDGPDAVHHRVIADHLRAASFLIADGVLPTNDGRGYVLRRIMRRGMRHAHMIGCRDPHMHRLVPELVRMMGSTFTELQRAESLITETLKLEENRFKQTLDRGLRLLEDAVEDLGDGQSLPGEVAFRLYDTYGFPLDLTQDILRGQSRAVDLDGFNESMERQRAAARKNWAGSGGEATEKVWFAIRDRIPATEFLGYDATVAEARIEAIVVDGLEVSEAAVGTDAMIVLNQTPFYGESGGQMGDIGTLVAEGGAQIVVSDTAKKVGDLHVHIGTIANANLAVGDVVRAAVDRDRRDRLRANHSATHLLHKALRDRLGDHVSQKGSLVAPERLRFDVSHPKPMTPAEVASVEADVNDMIRGNGDVSTRLMTPDAAVEAGALALFGEKYGDEVRVVSMGPADDATLSTELCGGTHVRRTGDIGLFRIVSEGAVGAGVRRIEALTGAAAFDHLDRQEVALREIAGTLKATPAEAPGRVAQLLEERRKLERELADARKKAAMGGGAESGGPAARDVGGIRFVGQVAEGISARDMKGMVDEMKSAGSGVYAMVGVTDGKAALVVGVTNDLKDRLSAVDLVRAGVGAIGGTGGGGRPDMAQGGGPNGDAAQDAINAVEAALAGSGS
ncbi:MAG: alanine--tRNA ligase [Minwuia sp.]|nr:alanine--tRNA ligase [Minwuia sp.]